MLIIDAYNALHCSHLLPDAHAMVSATGLARLLNQHDVPPHRGGAIVVADGLPKPDDNPDVSFDRVRVMFSGPGRDADGIIEELIDADSAPRSLVVVSNDRRIQRAAHRRRSNVWTSEQFMLRLTRVLESAAGAPPPQLGDIGDTAHWMQQFGMTDEASDTPPKPPPGLESETERWMREFGFEPDEDG